MKEIFTQVSAVYPGENSHGHTYNIYRKILKFIYYKIESHIKIFYLYYFFELSEETTEVSGFQIFFAYICNFTNIVSIISNRNEIIIFVFYHSEQTA